MDSESAGNCGMPDEPPDARPAWPVVWEGAGRPRPLPDARLTPRFRVIYDRVSRMKPPAFRYFAPSTLEEALELRAEHGSDSTVLAGGQSLVPLLNLRLAFPAVVIDLGRVEE